MIKWAKWFVDISTMRLKRVSRFLYHFPRIYRTLAVDDRAYLRTRQRTLQFTWWYAIPWLQNDYDDLDWR